MKECQKQEKDLSMILSVHAHCNNHTKFDVNRTRTRWWKKKGSTLLFWHFQSFDLRKLSWVRSVSAKLVWKCKAEWTFWYYKHNHAKFQRWAWTLFKIKASFFCHGQMDKHSLLQFRQPHIFSSDYRKYYKNHAILIFSERAINGIVKTTLDAGIFSSRYILTKVI